MMRVVTIPGGKGPAESLEVGSAPVPELRPGHGLVRVRAAGVNRPDLLQRAGRYPPPPGASPILGIEIAGEVAALGEGVTRWREGDAVVALLAGGGYAEYALVGGEFVVRRRSGARTGPRSAAANHSDPARRELDGARRRAALA